MKKQTVAWSITTQSDQVLSAKTPCSILQSYAGNKAGPGAGQYLILLQHTEIIEMMKELTAG